MKLSITTATTAPTPDDVRAALALNDWLLGAERLRRAGWRVDVTARGVRGARGPKFSARGRSRG